MLRLKDKSWYCVTTQTSSVCQHSFRLWGFAVESFSLKVSEVLCLPAVKSTIRSEKHIPDSSKPKNNYSMRKITQAIMSLSVRKNAGKRENKVCADFGGTWLANPIALDEVPTSRCSVLKFHATFTVDRSCSANMSLTSEQVHMLIMFMKFTKCWQSDVKLKFKLAHRCRCLSVDLWPWSSLRWMMCLMDKFQASAGRFSRD